jgi:hypothetical protein
MLLLVGGVQVERISRQVHRLERGLPPNSLVPHLRDSVAQWQVGHVCHPALHQPYYLRELLAACTATSRSCLTNAPYRMRLVLLQKRCVCLVLFVQNIIKDTAAPP